VIDERWTLWHEDGEEAYIDFTPRLAFSDLQVLLEATLDGAGIALLPEIHVREALATRRLVHILPAWRAPDSIVHMVSRADVGWRRQPGFLSTIWPRSLGRNYLRAHRSILIEMWNRRMESEWLIHSAPRSKPV
jgi:LysR substrate binding domain